MSVIWWELFLDSCPRKPEFSLNLSLLETYEVDGVLFKPTELDEDDAYEADDADEDEDPIDTTDDDCADDWGVEGIDAVLAASFSLSKRTSLDETDAINFLVLSWLVSLSPSSSIKLIDLKLGSR